MRIIVQYSHTSFSDYSHCITLYIGRTKRITLGAGFMNNNNIHNDEY